MRFFRPLIVVGLVALAAAWPVTAAAAESLSIAGTVTRVDGSPAGGVEVVVRVAASDMVLAATTDEAGAFAIDIEARVGDVLEIRATGATAASEPDEDGCVTRTTATGRADVTVEALALAPVVVVLDGAIEGRVCAATATPDRPEAPARTHRPEPTPPATDGSGPASGSESGWLVVAGLAGLLAGASLLIAARRRSPRG
jgi:LPXTG-motif cell wall-anchored protein